MGKAVLTIIGARPQFIKAAVVSRELLKLGSEEILAHTGQHYDTNLSELFFQELPLPAPKYFLGIGSGPHGWQTGRMLEELERIIQEEQPSLVLVYGDTNSTLAGALAAAKLPIPIAHVEAGLRSYNRRMPEEINRLLTDHLSRFLFCPTQRAVDNLLEEGFSAPCETEDLVIGDDPRLFKTGDVMFDLAEETKKHIVQERARILDRYGVKNKDFLLVTLHRAGNTDDPSRLKALWKGLERVSSDGLPIIFPLHPRTRKALEQNGLLDGRMPSLLSLIDPVGYRDMVVLESAARVVFTDSGGVQKESAFLGTPVVVPREETEWTELIEQGWVTLVEAEEERIARKIFEIRPPSRDVWGFGDGHGGEKIARIIVDYIEGKKER